MKLQEIKKFIREFPMPESLQLNKWSKITDLNMFFESHIANMESPNNPKKIKMLHYERVINAINLLKETKGANINTMTNVNIQKTSISPPEKQNDNKNTKNNDIDFKSLETFSSNSAIKPNNDFESPKSDNDNQMSLF